MAALFLYPASSRVYFYFYEIFTSGDMILLFFA